MATSASAPSVTLRETLEAALHLQAIDSNSELPGPRRRTKYGYDPVGNRTRMVDDGAETTYEHNWFNQLVAYEGADGRTELDYDGDGNRVEKRAPEGVTTYSWNPDNRLVRVDFPEGAVSRMGYNANGIRTFLEQDGRRTDFLLDDISVIADYQDGAPSATYTQSTSAIDEILAQEEGGERQPLLVDALGSVYGIADDAARVRTVREFDVYGDVASETGDIAGRWAFTGRELDDSGLLYARHRYLDPATGVWASPDPLRSADQGTPLEPTPPPQDTR